MTVSRGDIVEVGDRVGLMGSSGRSTGPHLHYEVIFQGKPYDPRGFLKAGRHVYEG
ncbi:MAG: M23 family metallopeptidase [Pseudomonadota bacterium]